MCSELATKRIRLDVVDERPAPVDLDDRQKLAVARLELRVARDVDLGERELLLAPQLGERRPGTLAEVAALGEVENDLVACYG